MACSRRFCCNSPVLVMIFLWLMIVSQTSSRPVFSTALQVMTGGIQLGEVGLTKCRAVSYCFLASLARLMLSPSALLTTMASATSSTPFLMPCNSSPAPEICSTRKKSTIEATVVSDWPTPTVSTIITSKPAASHTSMDSRVLRATPPKLPPEGEGRIKALGLIASCSIRVLSPRMEPPLRVLLGSMAKTATLCPLSASMLPKLSMKVLFPAPGTPVMPRRTALPVCGNSSLITSRAIS